LRMGHFVFSQRTPFFGGVRRQPNHNARVRQSRGAHSAPFSARGSPDGGTAFKNAHVLPTPLQNYPFLPTPLPSQPTHSPLQIHTLKLPKSFPPPRRLCFDVSFTLPPPSTPAIKGERAGRQLMFVFAPPVCRSPPPCVSLSPSLCRSCVAPNQAPPTRRLPVFSFIYVCFCSKPRFVFVCLLPKCCRGAKGGPGGAWPAQKNARRRRRPPLPRPFFTVGRFTDVCLFETNPLCASARLFRAPGPLPCTYINPSNSKEPVQPCVCIFCHCFPLVLCCPLARLFAFVPWSFSPFDSHHTQRRLQNRRALFFSLLPPPPIPSSSNRRAQPPYANV
jgi:hypothetical protein